MQLFIQGRNLMQPGRFKHNISRLFYFRTGPMVGLFLIALGTGGIKPCVSAFGGDQFGPHQVLVIFNRISYLTCLG